MKRNKNTEQTFGLLCTFLNGNDIMSLRENQAGVFYGSF